MPVKQRFPSTFGLAYHSLVLSDFFLQRQYGEDVYLAPWSVIWLGQAKCALCELTYVGCDIRS